MSISNSARDAPYEVPNLVSLGQPLISIFKYLDSTTLQQLRLTCHLFKQYIDETITSFTLETARPYSRLEDFQYEITRAALLWPSIKKKNFC